MKSFRHAPVVVAFAAMCACSTSDSEPPAAAGGGSQDAATEQPSGGSGGSVSEGGVGGSAGAAAGSAGAAGATLDDAGQEAEAAAPVASCSEIPGSKDCFANKDCPADRRCQNAGTPDAQVPCCVQGQRGASAVGAACTSENDCESGVCIAGDGPYMCSKDCKTVDDCPEGMKDCTPIAFSGSTDNWCFPTQ
jgi:hypothetical protein